MQIRSQRADTRALRASGAKGIAPISPQPDAPKADAMLARPAFSHLFFSAVLIASISCVSIAQQTHRGPAPTNARPQPKSTPPRAETGKSVKLAQNRPAAPPIRSEVDEPAPREPSHKVMRIASLTPEEVKAKQSTALRR